MDEHGNIINPQDFPEYFNDLESDEEGYYEELEDGSVVWVSYEEEEMIGYNDEQKLKME